MKSRASKGDVEVVVDILETRYGQMTKRDEEFARGISKFYRERGYLTEKQFVAARKLAVRQIVEVDPLFPKSPAFAFDAFERDAERRT